MTVEDVGSAANGVESAAGEVDQEVVAGGALDAPRDGFVEEIFREDPTGSADRSHDQVDLADSVKARLVRAGPAAILIPRRARLGAVFLDRQFAQGPDIPLGAVDGVPQERAEAAMPIGLGVREFQSRAAWVVLDLNKFRHGSLDGVADVAVERGVAIVPPRVNPGGEGLLVVTPVMIKGNAVFDDDPTVVFVDDIGLLDGEKRERFEQ